MIERNIQGLPGMRALTGPTYERSSQTIEKLRGFLSKRGYTAIDTPLLEETELFIRKSGGELTSRLYTFTDPGGYKVSLRPEFTSSVIRHFIQSREGLTLPVRWHYGGPVFRYGPEEGYRQFNQVGAELVGEAGVKADAEIIHLAWAGLQQIGMRRHQLRIGHLGVLHRLLAAYGLSEPAKLFIVTNIHALKNGSMSLPDLMERAESVGALRTGLDAPEGASLRDMDGEAAREFVQNVLKESMSSPVGRRSPDQIVARLLRKLHDTDDPGKFEEALSLVSRLARLDGPPETMLADARRIASDSGAGVDSFDELERLFESLSKLDLSADLLTLDLGLARGISYYTGVIFELMYSSPALEVSLGGGGRYDGLVRALGGSEDAPVLGFAYNLDQVVDVLDRGKPSSSQAPAGS